MLTQLHIRHFATIDTLVLDGSSGLTTLTGETGAGKSVIIDALTLALGQRGDSDLVRPGCKRAELCATFSLENNPSATQWLNERELDEERECQFRRTISSDGRSKAWINGRPSTLQDVRELADHLVSIHSQHEHQRLNQKHYQRELLDGYAGALPLVAEVNTAWSSWHSAQKTYNDALSAAAQHSEREELLRFQLQELNELALQENEISALEGEQQRLSHAEQLIYQCQQSLSLLFDAEDGTINDLIGRVSQQMGEASEQDSSLHQITDAIESTRLQLEAASDDLRHYLDRLELDPARLAEIEGRLDIIYTLSRKHRVRPEDLAQLHQRLLSESEKIDNLDEHLVHLQVQEQKAQTAYQRLAKQLSKKRRTEATKLSRNVLGHLNHLGMTEAKLEIMLHTVPPSAYGLEQIEILFSANPGQPPRALSKVASGGEMARVSLAIQVVCAERLTLPCLIFDEVDVGIGGSIADIVGQLLRQLGSTTQVFCITHQPQVASQGHQHWQVCKVQNKTSTHTDILPLSEVNRVEELARMLGGVTVTESTRIHAKEMLLAGQQR